MLVACVACASAHVGVDAHGMLRMPTSVRNDIRAPGEGCAGDPPANNVSKVRPETDTTPRETRDVASFTSLAAAKAVPLTPSEQTASLNHAFSSASIYHHNQTSQGTGCCGGGCLWFSQPANVDHPTLPHFARTMNPGVGGGPGDYSRYRPWRSPGAAPVLGSGCGAAGGGPMRLANGGNAPFVYKQGADAMDALPPKEPAVWTAGSEQDVAWAITANHGGGCVKARRRAASLVRCFAAAGSAAPCVHSGPCHHLTIDGRTCAYIPSCATVPLTTSRPLSPWRRQLLAAPVQARAVGATRGRYGGVLPAHATSLFH